MERLKQELSEAESAPATVNHYLKSLKAMFYRAIRAGKAEHNPVRGVTLLKENNARVRCLSEAEGEREILSPLVFCSPRGHFLSNFKRDWYPALRKAEIPDFRWHDTRHTAASRLVMAGVELYTVKEILGHKTLQMTARYSHLSPGHQREALERLTARRTVPAGPIQGPTGTATSTGGMVSGAAIL